MRAARGPEGLDEIVVGPRLEPFDAGFLARPGREEDDGDRGGRGVAAELAQDAESVEHRHHHIGITRSGGCRRAAARASIPLGTAVTS